MKTGAPRYKDIPIEVVGSTKFGRFSKMSAEQTFNMIIADDWMFPFAGYKNVDTINPTGQGRGIYSSAKSQKMFFVIDNDIWVRDLSGTRNFIGQILSQEGDVFIDENNINQVAFSDNENLYFYNYVTDTFVTRLAADLGFKPGYITFQNGRFVVPDLDTNRWRLSLDTDGSIFPDDAQHVGEISTKPTRAFACIRFPGRGNLLLVFGQTVGELWQDVGAQLFPYQRNQSTNIDYGLINPATLASLQDMVCWVAINEQSGPAIMYTSGEGIQKISTDGIDFKLSQLTSPANCYAFMVRLSGHLCYVVTWPTDNLTYLYDFNTQKFFTLCDEQMNAFIVKRVAFFDGQYYFVSLIDGNLYKLSADLFTYDYGNDVVHEIPYIRILDNINLPDQSTFNAGYSGFTIEQGEFDYTRPATNNIPRVDLTLSKDGGVNYGSAVKKEMNPQGVRKSRLMWRQLGMANDLVQQFRFHGFGRFVVTNGITGIYQ